MSGVGRGAASLIVLAALLAGAPARAEEVPEQAAPEAGAPQASSPSESYEEYDELYFEEDVGESDHGDPLEPINRRIFWVNDGLDRHVIEPISNAWDYVLPDFVQHAFRDAFSNLQFPIYFFNDLFQLKPVRASEDLARFVINSTVGIAGLMDPAAAIGLQKRVEDFGQTLGYWGVPAGPYLMLPFFGPSSVRDGVGLAVDTAFGAIGWFIPFWASAAMQAVETLNQRSLIRDEIQAERRAALDWYAAVRSAYTQYRENLVNDRREGTETEYDYYPIVAEDEE